MGNADLVVQDRAVTGNRTTGNAGGISNTGSPGTGNVTLVRSIVSRNVAGGSGGSMLASTATLTNSTVKRQSRRLRWRHRGQHGESDQQHRQR